MRVVDIAEHRRGDVDLLREVSNEIRKLILEGGTYSEDVVRVSEEANSGDKDDLDVEPAAIASR